MRQLSFWGEVAPLDSAPRAVGDVCTGDEARTIPPPSTESDSIESQLAESEVVAFPPSFKPLPAAVDAGVFGFTTAGAIEPDEREIAALTQEHSYELITTLVEIAAVQDALRSGNDPRTSRMPRTPEAAERAAERWRSELALLQSNYANMLLAFQEGFGTEAGAALDAWVRKHVAGSPQRLPYDPGHPWHYYWAGDVAAPPPYDAIPADDQAGDWLEHDLPKHAAKRRARLRELLPVETQRLQEDRTRYEDIATRGAEALSRFDREIAHGGNDELARASALALKYNHIRLGKGRVKWLVEQLGSDWALLQQPSCAPIDKCAG